jgi:outer membrane protein TolC
MTRIRKLLAIGLSCTTFVSSGLAAAAETNIRVDRPQSPIFVRPYQAATVPPIRSANSSRLSQLIRGGTLYLTVQDAIALAIENNIDLEVQRYNPLLSDWALERAEAGGPLKGVNTVSNSNFGVTAGQGVQGASSLVGNNGGNFGGRSGPSGGAVVSQIGPVTQNLDPVYQGTYGAGHQTQPQANPFLSGVEALIDKRRIYNNSLSQGFLTGGSLTLAFNNGYLNENAPTNDLNPSSAPALSLSLSQNLLNGFGIAVNSRTIRVARENVNVSDLQFQSQVISVVSNVLSLYWGLASDQADIRAKQGALDLAQRLYQDNKKQVQLGTMAPLDITQAESQLATSQRDLIFSQAAEQQQEVKLKDVLSRNGLGDPLLTNVAIVTLDNIDVPQKIDLQPLQNLVQKALGTRQDIAAEQINFENAQTSATGTANGVLPRLRVFATISAQGLSGQVNSARFAELPPPDSYYVGGFGTAVSQIFRRNFPSQNIGLSYNENVRNDVAQADYGIEQLQLRQSEINMRKDRNQVAVDISNQMISLRQAHSRYQAAVQSQTLDQQLVDAEEKKYKLGSSTTYNVIQTQRDLATAKSNVIAAAAQYANAKIGLERVLGTTLQVYSISLDEALSGRVARQSAAPPVPPRQ